MLDDARQRALVLVMLDNASTLKQMITKGSNLRPCFFQSKAKGRHTPDARFGTAVRFSDFKRRQIYSLKFC